ncbi:MAG: hypothetical protein PHR77_12090 [Kiritimatiellae bacterium]|nr:hypothetical protein [Kiritimatiellia bacterium]MDD5521328.1 hypothetical protein [Kiritimatiellia bacterium]
MNIECKKLLDCAVSAVKNAGNHALKNISRRTEIKNIFQHDIKLALDVECQAIATRQIHSAFPQHAIIGEEDASVLSGNTIDDDNYKWIIDPIDGTVNYSHGLSNWCCSIAVRYKGNSIAGAVYLPVIDELYTATIDQPAMRNGTEIHVSSINSLSEAIVLTGLDKNEGTALQPFEVFRNISFNTQKTRIMGSAAADICQVAGGKAEGYYESGIYIWDIAAAELIVKRAGGKAEILTQENNNSISFIASNGHIHSSLRGLI